MKLYLSTFVLAIALLLPSHVRANSPNTINPKVSLNTSAKQNNKIIDNWYKYTEKDGTYTILFPQAPQEEATNVMGMNTKFITSTDSKGRVYLSNGTKLPIQLDTKLIDIELLFNFALENVVKKANVSVESQKSITYNGLPGREAIIRFKDGNYFAKVRYVLDVKKSTLYQALITSESNNFYFPESTAFLDSLTIK